MELKPLTPSSLSENFGYKSQIAKNFIAALCSILKENKNDEFLEANFKQWYIFFQEVGGYKNVKINQAISLLKKIFSISISLEPHKILFAFHTYYSIIVRWLTYKIISQNIYSKSNEDNFNPNSINVFFKNLGINNFGKTACFDWYYNKSDTRLVQCFHSLDEILNQFNIRLSENNGDSEDLLKTFYQNLFPPNIRHSLGEYYTPDWLAELTISLSGYEFDLNKKILDPSCGSGTFILQIIKGIFKNQSIQNSESDLVKQVLKNVYGFDLNPIAVLAAKANYIISLRNFFPLKFSCDIPVYHFDSVLLPDLLDPPEIKLSLFKENKKIVRPVFEDKIPFNHQFDFIFGNPPWINWKFVPEYYREAVLPAAEKYNLFSHKGLKARLGFAQDDISVILTYVAIDHYLKDQGILSFVLPQTLFKTVGGGEGFRQFKLGKSGKSFKIISIMDLTDFKVFESAASKAALFTCQKGEETSYPIKYKILKTKPGQKIRNNDSLDSVLNKTIQFNHIASPLSDKTSNWITTEEDTLSIIKDIAVPSVYKARAGVCTWASAIYWVKPEFLSEKYVRIENVNDSAKYKQKNISTKIESQFVFPLVRGRDIKRWHFESNLSVILPQSFDSPAKAMGIKKLKEEYPLTYNYLHQFKSFLQNRKGYKKFLKDYPFYSVYDIGPYTFSKNKVAWKYLDSDMSAVVLSNGQNFKPLIPDLNVITISTDDLGESHYLAAFLNSSIIRFIIHTFGLCTRITPGVLNHLPIIKYSSGVEEHEKLSELSKKCHENFGNFQILETYIIEIDSIIIKILDIKKEQYIKIIENLKFYLNKNK